MAMRRRRATTKRFRGSNWRAGRWTGDQFGLPCSMAAECEAQLLGGQPFCWPTAADICQTQMFFPLLNEADFGPAFSGGIPLNDYQQRVTFISTEIEMHVSANPAWVLDAQQAGIGVGLFEFSWRFAIVKSDDDEQFVFTYPSLFNEDWLTRETPMYHTGGRFSFIGGATVDSVHTRKVKLRKPVRLKGGEGVYALWELGCVVHEGQQAQDYATAVTVLGGGPVCLMGMHRTFYLNS